MRWAATVACRTDRTEMVKDSSSLGDRANMSPASEGLSSMITLFTF